MPYGGSGTGHALTVQMRLATALVTGEDCKVLAALGMLARLKEEW